MSEDIDIKIKVASTQAELKLKRLAVASGVLDERTKQAAIRTQILTDKQKRLAAAASGTSKKLNVMNIALASFVGNITSRAVSAGVTSLIRGLTGLVGAGKDFEKGLIEIAKTTGLGESATKSFGDEITKLSQRMPVATENLLEIAKVAGQLGIKGTENLTAFTETMAKLQLATDIAGEEGSQNVAKILDITGELQENGVENIKKFGSVITKLGNDFAATESQILSVAKEVAKGTAAFGVASEDILGLATAFKATGSEAETAGSAIQRAFIQMGSAVEEGGQSLNKFADAAGITSEEFETMFRSDPTMAFLTLSKGIRDSSKSGSEMITKLKGLGLGSIRVTKALVPLISRYDTLSRAVSEAREESEVKTALDNEAAKAQKSLAADVVKLSNSYAALGKVLFSVIGPALRAVVQTMADFINILIDEENRQLIKTLAVGLGLVSVGLTAVAIHAAVTSGAFGFLAVAATAAWTAVFGPIGLGVLAIGLIGAAIYDIVTAFNEVERNDAIKQQAEDAQSLADGYEDADQKGKDFLNTQTSILGIQNGILAPLQDNADALYVVADGYVNLNREIAENARISKAAAVEVTLFERDKTKELKKFFKEQEIAKLTSSFSVLKNLEEIAAFESTIISLGRQRRKQSHLALIGQDKASIESAKARQAELDRMADVEKKRDQTLFESKVSLSIAERELELLISGEKKILREVELQDLVDIMDRQSQAEAQAKLESITNEKERETAIAEIHKEALDNKIQRIAAAEKAIDQIIKKAQDGQAKRDEREKRAKVNRAQTALGSIATLQNSHNKEMAILGKAAAIANITINTARGVMEAFKLGPILGPILAPIVAIAGAAQAANVASANYAQGGIVPGSSFTGDKVGANVNSGEMILNRQQQSQLFKQANGQGSSGSGQMIQVTVQSVLDGEIVAESVSKQVANGLVLGEVQ